MSRPFRIVSTAVAALALIYAVVTTWRQNERAAGLDFYIYFVNAQLAGRADIPNIYDRDVQSRIGEEYYERAQRSSSELRKFDAKRRRFLDSVSSPFLYTSLAWVSRDYDRALWQYHVLVLTAFMIGFLLIARKVRLSWASALFLLAALLLWYRGFEADLRVGNVNSLQLMMLGISLWCPPVLAGTIAGMLIAFKPNLILVPILLAVARMAARDWRRLRLEVLGGAIGGGIAFLAAAMHYRSFGIWLQWIARANEFYHRLPTRTERNITPLLALFHEHGAWPSYALALLLTIIAVIAIWRACGAPASSPAERAGVSPAGGGGGTPRAQPARTPAFQDVLIIGVAVLIYLLSATVVWLHYMVIVIPIALALMQWRTTAIVSLLALATIAEEPFELLTRTAIYPNDAKLIGPALFALFACAIWRLSRGATPPPTRPPARFFARRRARVVA